ncbi:MAG: hypothetical protein ACUVQQ_13695 [Thermogutta sp.]
MARSNSHAVTGPSLRSRGTSSSRWAAVLAACFLFSCFAAAGAAEYQDRFVWIFGWGLSRDTDVDEINRVLQSAAESGCNGAVVSFGLDSLCKRSPDYFRRLEAVQETCRRLHLELIPAVFSVGYGGGILAHNRYLAEGLPVRDALFVARGDCAVLEPDSPVEVANGGFEEFAGNRFRGYNFHDQPGEVSFADTQVFHGGKASLRMENFGSNPHGHGRVMQEVPVHPYRCYRVTCWVKTEQLMPRGAFRIQVLAGERALAPLEFGLPETADWTKCTFIFNSLQFDRVRLYAGVWGGRGGRFWLDDWSIEEIGPLNVLRRPGTPVTVKSEDGTVYEEGKDYLPLEDPAYSPYRVDREVPALRLTETGRIRPGQRLRVSWYHSQKIHDSQITVCMGEPELYEIFDHEAALLAQYLRPKKVLLNMDEIRMGGTCEACRGRDMAELLGTCVRRQVESLRRHNPGVEVYIWSDMFDPHQNAHGDYYLVEGDFTGSWKHVPQDVIMAVWGGTPRPQSLKFFADQGFRTLIACYYDANDLTDVRGWMREARDLPGIRGLMYTPWTKRYDLLPEFGRLISDPLAH